MIRQIVIEAELPDDAQSMFRLSINANLIAKGVTAARGSLPCRRSSHANWALKTR
jgi:hypothetical protein